MSKPNKKINLNKNDFLKLLDENLSSDKTIAFNNTKFNVDEFEQDALDGFADFSKINEPQQLIAEVDKKITDRVNNGVVKKTSTYAWIGAAASVALIILLSVFVYNKSKNILTEPTIALNTKVTETKNVEINSATHLQNSDALLTKNTTTDIKIDTKILSQKNKLPTYTIKAIAESTSEFENEKRQDENDVKKNEFSNVPSKSSIATTNAISQTTTNLALNTIAKLDTEKKGENSALDNKSIAMNDVVTLAPSVTKSNIDLDYLLKEKTEADESAKEKKLTDKKYNAKSGALKNAENSTLENMPSTMQTTAFYLGGELAIKNYVLEYYKKEGLTNDLKGNFKITVNVNAKGIISVKTITNTTNDCKGCDFELMQAISTLPKWAPATSNGAAIASEKTFVLLF